MIKSKERLKKKEIRKALSSNPVDIAQLRKLSISYGGLINSELRRRVWPHLLGVADKFVDVDDDFDYESNKDYNQVHLSCIAYNLPLTTCITYYYFLFSKNKFI